MNSPQPSPEPNLIARLTCLMREFFADDSIVFQPATRVFDIKGWDSAAHVRFILTLESRFRIKFSAKEMASFRTLGDLGAVMESKLPSGDPTMPAAPAGKTQIDGA